MVNHVGRRDFIRLTAASLGALAVPPLEDHPVRPSGLGRVTTDWIGVYTEPSFRAPQLDRLFRDQLISLGDRVNSDDGPQHNPVWYQLPDGYAHSGHLQLVDWRPQTPRRSLPEGGALFEISVPFTRTYRQPNPSSDPLYRLYFQSTAWVVDSLTGEDGRIWYKLKDDLLKVHYYARGEHLRRIPEEEFNPISVSVPAEEKRIRVDLYHQELFCYEYDKVVFRTRISSGIPDTRPRANGIPTITPTGVFFVEVKVPLRHMGDGNLTSDLTAYELPGVPWVSFFTSTGVAFHGTYWHNDFGRPKSHGCINMNTEEAKWLYRWSNPIVPHHEMRRIARGTLVQVI